MCHPSPPSHLSVWLACVLCVLTLLTHVINPNSRIRFAMWVGNDYLPAFRGVGWQTAKNLHKEFETLDDEEAEVRMCTHAPYVNVIYV